MPQALCFDEPPPRPPQGASRASAPSALNFGDAPAADATLENAVREAARTHSLPQDKLSSALLQAKTLRALQPGIVETWGAQALEQHASGMRAAAMLRDRINASGLGEVLAKVNAELAGTGPPEAPTLLERLLPGRHGACQPLDWDAKERQVTLAGEGAQTFVHELAELAPACTQTRWRLTVLLTSAQAVLAAASSQPGGQDLLTRLDVRQDLLARAVVQAALLEKTLEVLTQTATAWRDQSQFITAVLLPARRLASP